MFSSAPPVKAGPAVSRRLVWIDALKGAAILLVVGAVLMWRRTGNVKNALLMVLLARHRYCCHW